MSPCLSLRGACVRACVSVCVCAWGDAPYARSTRPPRAEPGTADGPGGPSARMRRAAAGRLLERPLARGRQGRRDGRREGEYARTRECCVLPRVGRPAQRRPRAWARRALDGSGRLRSQACPGGARGCGYGMRECRNAVCCHRSSVRARGSPIRRARRAAPRPPPSARRASHRAIRSAPIGPIQFGSYPSWLLTESALSESALVGAQPTGGGGITAHDCPSPRAGPTGTRGPRAEAPAAKENEEQRVGGGGERGAGCRGATRDTARRNAAPAAAPHCDDRPLRLARSGRLAGLCDASDSDLAAVALCPSW